MMTFLLLRYIFKSRIIVGAHLDCTTRRWERSALSVKLVLVESYSYSTDCISTPPPPPRNQLNNVYTVHLPKKQAELVIKHSSANDKLAQAHPSCVSGSDPGKMFKCMRGWGRQPSKPSHPHPLCLPPKYWGASGTVIRISFPFSNSERHKSKIHVPQKQMNRRTAEYKRLPLGEC